MKKNTVTGKSSVPAASMNLDGLLDQLRTLIVQARRQALRAVDVVQVRTCWEMGRHIVESEQGGAERAEYGTKLLSRLAERLTAEFGKGFDASNLRYMRLFYQAFPNCDALHHELSWTHYRLLMQAADTGQRIRLRFPSVKKVQNLEFRYAVGQGDSFNQLVPRMSPHYDSPGIPGRSG